MKVVVLAGGLGTRLSEETKIMPKPMVEIGGKPILWHIMKIYSHYGFNEFIICCGYKGEIIKDYFLNYNLINSDFTIDLDSNQSTTHRHCEEKFKVTLVDTGANTNTAGRIKLIEKYVNGETFMLTYGDGVSDINILELIQFHKNTKSIATVTTVQLPGRFGNVKTNADGKVLKFQEKPEGDEMWINGGFFILEREIFEYLRGDVMNVQWEMGPLVKIADDGKLSSFKHNGFWKCMDALRDKVELEELWASGNAKWKVW